MERKNFKIEKYDFERDTHQVMLWEKLYGNTPEYENIKHFILEDDIFYNLGEVISVNGGNMLFDDEHIITLSVKADDGEIIGVVILNPFRDLEDQMNIRYVILNPKYQHQGYGPEILNHIFTNLEEYTHFNPKKFYSVIHQDNIASMKLFSKFGFKFNFYDNQNYLRAIATDRSLMIALEHQKEQRE